MGANEFKIEYSALNQVSQDINKIKDDYSKKIDNAAKAINSVIKYERFQGSSAEAMRRYFTNTYNTINKQLKQLVITFAGNFCLFYSDLIDIESDKFGRIESEELKEIRKQINTYKTNLETIDANISSYLKNVIDLFEAPNRYSKDHVSMYNDIIYEGTYKIITDVRSVDNKHCDSAFSCSTEIIKALNNILDTYLGKERKSIKDYEFSMEDIGLLISEKALTIYSVKEKERYDSNAVKIQNVEVQSNKIAKEISDYKAREQTAKWINLAVDAVFVVASVAVIVGTAGMGTGVVIAGMASLGAVKGAVTKGTEMLTDEYVENGDLKDADWGKISEEMIVSGVSGGIKGAIDGALLGVSMGPVTKTVKDVGLNVLEGTQKRAVGAYIDAGKALANGSDLKTVADDMLHERYDSEEIRKDLRDGLQEAAIGSIADEILPDTGKKEMGKYIQKAMKKSGEKVISGGLERYQDKIEDGYEVSEAYASATDPFEVASDGISGAKGGAKSYYKDNR